MARRHSQGGETAQSLMTATAGLCLGIAITSGSVDLGVNFISRSPIIGSLIIAGALLYGLAAFVRRGSRREKSPSP